LATQANLDRYLLQRLRPAGRAVMYQRWSHLLFLHWRFAPEIIQATLPLGLQVDTFDSAAWVGVVPFDMRNIRPWWSPAVPGISHFLELNLRTYVVDRHGTPGVWFYFLECNQPLAVWWGRTWFKLPYLHSKMTTHIDARTHRHRYHSCRRQSDASLACKFEYEPTGPIRLAQPGTLEFFLAERYILFTQLAAGRLASGQVHHPPYPLQDVDVGAYDNHAVRRQNLAAGENFDHALYSPGVDVEVFPLKPI
jgi:uncharacterized protein YqjF (DUF2071 family)